MMCKVRNPSRRGGWRSRGRGAVGRRAAREGVYDALDQVVSKEVKLLFGCLVCAAWWSLALVFCRTAYASPSVEIDGNFAGYENNETYNGYVVVDSPSDYIATLVLIDEYSSLVQIDNEVYAKLMSESHGGRFWELMQLWEKLGTNASGTSSNYPTWAGSTYFIDGLVTVYGYGRVWECVTTDALIDGAKDDFNTILDGGDVGVSGGNNNNDAPSEFYVYYTGNNAKIDNLEEIQVVVSENAQSKFEQIMSGDNTTSSIYSYWYFSFNNINQYGSWVWFTTGTDIDVVLNNGTLVGVKNNSNSTVDFDNYVPTISYNNGVITITDIYSGGHYNHEITSNNTYDLSNITYFSDIGDGNGAGGGNDEPVPTPPDEPKDPVAPSPNPPTPTTPDPDPGPTLPPIDPHDPVIPSPPTNEPAPTGTTPTDYTPWLRAILQQLVNLTSYLETCFTWLGTVLDEHCQHIRDHMTTCFNWLGEYQITGMSNLLGEHHTFLNGLAQWIVDNIKWENSGGEFDDSNMIYWLRRIYARQGAGDVNSRPVDPATDYIGFAGWLGVLYDAVALDVSDTSLTALTSSLSGLQHTFPFSLPWDVKQVLQALDVSPVTPSASIPSGTSGVSYDVDLHWMDSAMVSVRAFELLVFIVYVMVHTKDLFGYLMGE